MIALHPTYVLANREAIEGEIERLIGLLDAADMPDEDLEPEPDDVCLAGDDGLHPFVRQDGTFWGAGENGFSPVLPRYDIDQTAGPINEREMHRDHAMRT